MISKPLLAASRHFLKDSIQAVCKHPFKAGIGSFRCIICRTHCAVEPSLCEGCLSILPWLNPAVCLICGAHCGTACHACCPRRDPFRHRFAVFEYAFPVDGLLKKFKYQDKRDIGRTLGQILAQSAKHSGLIEHGLLFLPVPLALSKRKVRGFNQAADIAEVCSQVSGIPWSDQLLCRHAHTPMLAGLSPIERQFALLGAFAASKEVAGKNIVLIDDVLTSGATCFELYRELKDKGAASVSVWTVARAIEYAS